MLGEHAGRPAQVAETRPGSQEREHVAPSAGMPCSAGAFRLFQGQGWCQLPSRVLFKARVCFIYMHVFVEDLLCFCFSLEAFVGQC